MPMDRRLRRSWVLIAAALAVLGPVGCSSDDAETSTTTAAPSSTTTSTTSPPSTTTIFTPDAAALWLANPDAAGIVRIDAVDPDELSGAEVGFAPRAVAVDNGVVWIGGDGRVAAVDSASVSILGSVEIDGSVDRLIPTSGAVWALVSDSAVPIDRETVTAGNAVNVNEPVAAVAGSSAMWIVGSGDLVQIDLATNTRVTSYETSIAAPASIQLGSDSVLVFAQDGTVHRINPADGSVLGETKLTVAGIPPGGVLATDDGFWVADTAGQVVAVDVDLTQGVGVEVGESVDHMALAADSLWVTSDNGSIVRISLDDFLVLQFPLDFLPAGLAAS